MADSTISGLPSASTVAGTEVLPIDQSSTTVKVAVANLTRGLTALVGDSGSGGTKGLVPAPASGDAAAGKFLKADATWAVPPGTGGGGGTTIGAVCNGRLTLTSGTAVTTSDVTGATTIYFTPYNGYQIATYDSSVWTIHTLTEISIALGTLTSGKNYDVFVYNNSGTLTLEFSSAWTNDTTRADALALQDGIYVKSADHSRRYLGTFRTTSTTTTEDSGGGTTTQVGGKRFLWNYYNRIERFLSVIDTTLTWTYNTDTWRQADGASGNKVEYVCGINEVVVTGTLIAGCQATSNSAKTMKASVGLDSTTVPSRLIGTFYNNNSTTVIGDAIAPYAAMAGLGYHYLAWLERGGDGTSNVFFGSSNNTQSGLNMSIRG